MSVMRYFLFLVTIFMVTQTFGERKFSVAVMPFVDTSDKFDLPLLENATEIFRGYLTSSGKFNVIDKSRQAEKLKKIIRDYQEESYNQCYDKKCQIPLGQALSADAIIRTTVTCIENICTLSSEMVDLAKEASTAGGIESFDGTAKGLAVAIKSVAHQLAGREAGSPQEVKTETKTIRPYRWHSAGSFLLGGLSLAAGILYDFDADDSFDKASVENKNFRETGDIFHKNRGESYTSDGRDSLTLRNIFYISSAALTSTAILLFMITEEEASPDKLSFFIDDKTIYIGYSFHF